MQELEVLDGGQLELSWEERREFLEEELREQVRGEVKRLWEKALEEERTAWLGVKRYGLDAAARQDYRNGYYARALGTRGGWCGGYGCRLRGGGVAANCSGATRRR